MRALVLNCTLKPSPAESNTDDGDQWPRLRAKVLESEILVMASPTWPGTMSSVAKRVLARMDAMISETDDQGRPVAYNHVAGVIVTGNLVAVARALQATPMPPPAGS